MLHSRLFFCQRSVVAFATLLVISASSLAAEPPSGNQQRGVVLSTSGPWTSRDYMQVLVALLHSQITLPRRGNPKTVEFFTRLVDRKNIEHLMAGSLAAAQKRTQILVILAVTGEFRGRYGYAVSLGDDLGSELVEVQEFRLYLIGRLALLDAEDGQTACPVGYTCDNAIATALSGTLDTLSDRKVFTNDQRLALSNALAEHYPAIRMKLTNPEHRDITARLAAIEANEDDPALRSALAAALQAARGGN